MTNFPNFILIVADQMRADCLGAEGRRDIDTPNLDCLAARGSRFCHAYSAVPSCVPARASLMTGMDQWHTGILGMGEGQPCIPCDHPFTLAGELTAAGYQTHLVGKAHFSPPAAKMGFESLELDESGRHAILGRDDDYIRWFRENAPRDVTPVDHGIDPNSWMARPWHTAEHLHPSAWTMNRALNFLNTREKERPFFLNIAFARPHSPYVPPDYYFRLHDGRISPPAIGDWASGNDRPEDAVESTAWRGRQTERMQTRARAGYFGEVSFIDTQIGRLLNEMRRLHPDLLHNTWFLFISDHGDMLGDHHLWRKTYAYEGSARIPLIITAPPQAGINQRKVIDEVVEIRDIMPTILDAAGLKIPPSVVGKSLLEPLEKKPDTWRPYLHGEHCTIYSPEQEMQFVTNGARKFIWLPRTGQQQFFDLKNDPNELNDLSASVERSGEAALWRRRLILELQERNCGWCTDGTLSCTPGHLYSPYRYERYLG